jgi:hypothetical protein
MNGTPKPLFPISRSHGVLHSAVKTSNGVLHSAVKTSNGIVWDTEVHVLVWPAR